MISLQASYRPCLLLQVKVLRGHNVTLGQLDDLCKYPNPNPVVIGNKCWQRLLTVDPEAARKADALENCRQAYSFLSWTSAVKDNWN